MIVTGSLRKVREASRAKRKLGKVIGFVPTMGALHKGHLSLIKRARKECDSLAVSIFINPKQFENRGDYCSYPRDFSRDRQLLSKVGVDLLFYPKASAMYSSCASVYADENSLSRLLCGKRRPGHFRGVCTVLVKLFNIVEPDIVYFGRKDYQQAQIVKKLISDLNFPIKMRVLPTVREKDNLAMSSRNVRLKGQSRRDSRCLYEALSLARALIKAGQRDVQRIIDRMKQVVKSRKSAKIGYIEIVDADSLKRLERIKGRVLVALAVYIKKVRLIDNIILNVKK